MSISGQVRNSSLSPDSAPPCGTLLIVESSLEPSLAVSDRHSTYCCGRGLAAGFASRHRSSKKQPALPERVVRRGKGRASGVSIGKPFCQMVAGPLHAAIIQRQEAGANGMLTGRLATPVAATDGQLQQRRLLAVEAPHASSSEDASLFSQARIADRCANLPCFKPGSR